MLRISLALVPPLLVKTSLEKVQIWTFHIRLADHGEEEPSSLLVEPVNFRRSSLSMTYLRNVTISGNSRPQGMVERDLANEQPF